MARVRRRRGVGAGVQGARLRARPRARAGRVEPRLRAPPRRARRALARCRAEQYARFAELLERLAADETRRDETGDETGDETRALRLSTLREKLATTETDHAARILRVTFGRRAVAEKQLLRRSDARSGSDLENDENDENDASLLAGESDMADPPTLAEMLAATRVLRGCWVHAPASCAAAGAAGAAGADSRARAPRARRRRRRGTAPRTSCSARSSSGTWIANLWTTTQKETRTVSPHRIVTRRL